MSYDLPTKNNGKKILNEIMLSYGGGRKDEDKNKPQSFNLKEHYEGVHINKKKHLIRNLAQELLGVLNINSNKLKNMNIKDIIKVIKDVTPNVKRGDKLHENSIKKICDKLAKAINKLFKGTGTGIISNELSCKDKYIKSKEILDSLFVGLHVEFLNVAKGVKDTSDDLQTIMAYLDEMFKIFIGKLKESQDSKNISKQEIYNLEFVYKNLRKEIQRLLEILSNYINISTGDYPSLEKLFTDNYLKKTSSRISQNLKIKEEDFSTALINLLSGYKDIVIIAEKTLDSLKTLKLDPSILKKSTSEFKKIINNKFINIGVDVMTNKKDMRNSVIHLEEMLAGNYKNKVEQYLKKKGKIRGGLHNSNNSNNDNRPLREKLDLDTEKSNLKFYTEKVLDTFSEGFQSLNHKFLNNIENLSEDIIKGHVKSSLSLEKFIKFFIQIDDEYLVTNLSNNKNLNSKNLSGLSYRLDDISKKEKYISFMRALMNLSEQLAKETKANIFREIKNNIQQILSFMGKYSDIVKKNKLQHSAIKLDSSNYLDKFDSKYKGGAITIDETGEWIREPGLKMTQIDEYKNKDGTNYVNVINSVTNKNFYKSPHKEDVNITKINKFDPYRVYYSTDDFKDKLFTPAKTKLQSIIASSPYKNFDKDEKGYDHIIYKDQSSYWLDNILNSFKSNKIVPEYVSTNVNFANLSKLKNSNKFVYLSDKAYTYFTSYKYTNIYSRNLYSKFKYVNNNMSDYIGRFIDNIKISNPGEIIFTPCLSSLDLNHIVNMLNIGNYGATNYKLFYKNFDKENYMGKLGKNLIFGGVYNPISTMKGDIFKIINLFNNKVPSIYWGALSHFILINELNNSLNNDIYINIPSNEEIIINNFSILDLVALGKDTSFNIMSQGLLNKEVSGHIFLTFKKILLGEHISIKVRKVILDRYLKDMNHYLYSHTNYLNNNATFADLIIKDLLLIKHKNLNRQIYSMFDDIYNKIVFLRRGIIDDLKGVILNGYKFNNLGDAVGQYAFPSYSKYIIELNELVKFYKLSLIQTISYSSNIHLGRLIIYNYYLKYDNIVDNFYYKIKNRVNIIADSFFTLIYRIFKTTKNSPKIDTNIKLSEQLKALTPNVLLLPSLEGTGNDNICEIASGTLEEVQMLYKFIHGLLINRGFSNKEIICLVYSYLINRITALNSIYKYNNNFKFNYVFLGDPEILKDEYKLMNIFIFMGNMKKIGFNFLRHAAFKKYHLHIIKNEIEIPSNLFFRINEFTYYISHLHIKSLLFLTSINEKQLSKCDIVYANILSLTHNMMSEIQSQLFIWTKITANNTNLFLFTLPNFKNAINKFIALKQNNKKYVPPNFIKIMNLSLMGKINNTQNLTIKKRYDIFQQYLKITFLLVPFIKISYLYLKLLIKLNKININICDPQSSHPIKINFNGMEFKYKTKNIMIKSICAQYKQIYTMFRKLFIIFDFVYFNKKYSGIDTKITLQGCHIPLYDMATLKTLPLCTLDKNNIHKINNLYGLFITNIISLDRQINIIISEYINIGCSIDCIYNENSIMKIQLSEADSYDPLIINTIEKINYICFKNKFKFIHTSESINIEASKKNKIQSENYNNGFIKLITKISKNITKDKDIDSHFFKKKKLTGILSLIHTALDKDTSYLLKPTIKKSNIKANDELHLKFLKTYETFEIDEPKYKDLTISLTVKNKFEIKLSSLFLNKWFSPKLRSLDLDFINLISVILKKSTKLLSYKNFLEFINKSHGTNFMDKLNKICFELFEVLKGSTIVVSKVNDTLKEDYKIGFKMPKKSNVKMFKELKYPAKFILRGYNNIDTATTSKIEGGKVEDMINGGGYDDINWKNNFIKSINQSTKNLKNKLVYFYKLANMLQNNKILSSELLKYSENYKEMLGKYVGKIKNECLENTFEIIKDLNNYNNVSYNIKSERALLARYFYVISDTDCSKTTILETTANINLLYLMSNLNHKDISLIRSSIGVPDKYLTPFVPDTKIDNIIQQYKRIMNFICKSKIDFYEVAESIDICLMEVNQQLMKDPSIVKNISSILNNINLISNWFSNRSGNILVSVFELFPFNINIKNIVKDSDDKSLNYGSIDTNNHYYKFFDNNTKLPSDPTNSVLGTSKYINTLFNKINLSIKSVKVLENLINIFIKLTPNINTQNSLLLSPKQLFTRISNYIVATSIKYKSGKLLGSAKLNRTAVYKKFCNNFSLSLNMIGSLTDKGLYEFENELDDKIFIMTIKSIITKIISTIGLHKILYKSTSIIPFNPNRLLLQGGAEKSISPYNNIIRPKLVNLYTRLILLLEWYKNLFYYDGSIKDNNLSNIITVLPNTINNEFRELIEYMFLKTAESNNNSYDYSQINSLVGYINKIYDIYKNKRQHNLPIDRIIINDLINEINIRYGIIKNTQLTNYIQSYDKYNSSNIDNYKYYDNNILLDSYKDGHSNLLPSNKYAGYKKFSRSYDEFKDEKHANLVKAAIEMKKKMTKSLITPFLGKKKINNKNIFMLKNNINKTAKGIQNAASSNKKLELMQSLINGNVFNYSEDDATLLFHELVITPLSILTGIYNYINNFKIFCQVTDLKYIEKCMIDKSDYPSIDQNVAFEKFLNTKIKTKMHTTSEVKIKKILMRYINDNVTISTEAGAECMPLNLTHLLIRFELLVKLNKNNKNNKKKECIVENFIRWGINSKKLMYDILYNLTVIGSDCNNLITVDFTSNNGPEVNFSKLTALCIRLINHVKNLAFKFQGILPTNIINKLLSTKNENIDNLGSIVNLERNLINNLLKNRNNNGLKNAIGSLKNTWNYLTKRYKSQMTVKLKFTQNRKIDFNTFKILVLNDDNTDVIYKNSQMEYISFEGVLSELSYWCHNKIPFVNLNNIKENDGILEKFKRYTDLDDKRIDKIISDKVKLSSAETKLKVMKEIYEKLDLMRAAQIQTQGAPKSELMVYLKNLTKNIQTLSGKTTLKLLFPKSGNDDDDDNNGILKIKKILKTEHIFNDKNDELTFLTKNTNIIYNKLSILSDNHLSGKITFTPIIHSDSDPDLDLKLLGPEPELLEIDEDEDEDDNEDDEESDIIEEKTDEQEEEEKLEIFTKPTPDKPQISNILPKLTSIDEQNVFKPLPYSGNIKEKSSEILEWGSDDGIDDESDDDSDDDTPPSPQSSEVVLDKNETPPTDEDGSLEEKEEKNENAYGGDTMIKEEEKKFTNIINIGGASPPIDGRSFMRPPISAPKIKMYHPKPEFIFYGPLNNKNNFVPFNYIPFYRNGWEPQTDKEKALSDSFKDEFKSYLRDKSNLPSNDLNKISPIDSIIVGRDEKLINNMSIVNWLPFYILNKGNNKIKMSNEENKSNGGLLIDFNRAYALYLQEIQDPITKKIHKNLLSSMFKEAHSEIFEKKGLLDYNFTENYTTSNKGYLNDKKHSLYIHIKKRNNMGGNRKYIADYSLLTPSLGEPIEPHNILLGSLSEATRFIATLKLPKSTESEFLSDEITSLSDMGKYKLNGFLPYFNRIFKTIKKRCQILGLSLNGLSNNLYRNYKFKFINTTKSNYIFYGKDNKNKGAEIVFKGGMGYGLKTPCTKYKEHQNKQYLNIKDYYSYLKGDPPSKEISQILKSVVFNGNKKVIYLKKMYNKIISCCKAIELDINTTITELNDNPKFFENSDNSINNFKDENNVNPLSLISNILMPLSTLTNGFEIYDWQIPNNDINNNMFKFMYGSRLALGYNPNNINISKIIGFPDLINKYNQETKISASIIDINTIGSLIIDLCSLGQYLQDTCIYGNVFSSKNTTISNKCYDEVLYCNSDTKINAFIDLHPHTEIIPYQLMANIHSSLISSIKMGNIHESFYKTNENKISFYKYVICKYLNIDANNNLKKDIKVKFIKNMLNKLINNYNNYNYDDNDKMYNDISQIINQNISGINNKDKKLLSNLIIQLILSDSSNISIESVLDISVDNDIMRQKSLIIKTILKGKKFDNGLNFKNDRNQLLVINISDINRLPINQNLLIRELPFCNLINYSYNFDISLTHYFNKINNYGGNMTSESKSIKNSINNPYRKVTPNEFLNIKSLIYSGASKNTHYKIPKYLSYQLWNKVLLGDLYPLGPIKNIKNSSNQWSYSSPMEQYSAIKLSNASQINKSILPVLLQPNSKLTDNIRQSHAFFGGVSPKIKIGDILNIILKGVINLFLVKNKNKLINSKITLTKKFKKTNLQQTGDKFGRFLKINYNEKFHTQQNDSTIIAILSQIIKNPYGINSNTKEDLSQNYRLILSKLNLIEHPDVVFSPSNIVVPKLQNPNLIAKNMFNFYLKWSKVKSDNNKNDQFMKSISKLFITGLKVDNANRIKLKDKIKDLIINISLAYKNFKKIGGDNAYNAHNIIIKAVLVNIKDLTEILIKIFHIKINLTIKENIATNDKNGYIITHKLKNNISYFNIDNTNEDFSILLNDSAKILQNLQTIVKSNSFNHIKQISKKLNTKWNAKLYLTTTPRNFMNNIMENDYLNNKLGTVNTHRVPTNVPIINEDKKKMSAQNIDIYNNLLPKVMIKDGIYNNLVQNNKDNEVRILLTLEKMKPIISPYFYSPSLNKLRNKIYQNNKFEIVNGQIKDIVKFFNYSNPSTLIVTPDEKTILINVKKVINNLELEKNQMQTRYLYASEYVRIKDCLTVALLITEATIDMCLISDSKKKDKTKSKFHNSHIFMNFTGGHNNFNDAISNENIINSLHYYNQGKDKTKRKTLQTLDISRDAKKFREIGYKRYNTKLIRNIEWFVNLQSFVKEYIKDELKMMRSKIISANTFVYDDSVNHHNTNYRDDDDDDTFNDYY